MKKFQQPENITTFCQCSYKNQFFIAAIGMIIYLGCYYYFDFHQHIALQTAAIKQKKFFFLSTNAYFRLRSGLNQLQFSAKIKFIDYELSKNMDLNLTATSGLAATHRRRGTIDAIKKINDFTFQIENKKDLYISKIRFFPKQLALKDLRLKIVYRPQISISLVLLQLALVFLALLTILILGKNIYQIVVRNEAGSLANLVRHGTYTFLLLITVFYVFLIFHPSYYLQILKNLSINPWRLLLENVLLAILLSLVSYIIYKNFIQYHWVLISAAILLLFITPAYNVRLCGDASRWIGHISENSVHASDALSSLLTKATYSLMAHFISALSPVVVLNIVGKMVGFFYLIAIYFLLKNLTDLTEKTKAIFAGLSLILPSISFMFGYPEYAYYPLPLIIFSLVFALKYLQNAWIRDLFWSGFFLAIGGAFHGSAFFALPAYLLLPLLPAKSAEKGICKLKTVSRKYLVMIFTVVITILMSCFLIHALGYELNFENINGATNESRFVEFLPVNDIENLRDKIFLEIGYFIERTWIFLASFPVIFIIMKRKMIEKNHFSPSSAIFFMYGIMLSLVTLFWDFDFGIRDFDLYISPMSIINLFFLWRLIIYLESRDQLLRKILIIFLFAVTSSILMLIHIWQ